MRLSLVTLLLVVGSAAHAQIFTGRVIDRTDSATVSGAQVSVGGAGSIRTNTMGQFRIGDVSVGRHEISVRMLGYAAYVDTIEVLGSEGVTRDLYLTRVPRLLSQMVVKGRSMRVPTGFEDIYRRGANGAGVFLTREQIDSINPTDVIALLHEVPFVHVNPNEDAPNRLETSRCRQLVPGSNVSGGLVAVYFNGVPMTDGTSLNEILSHLAPSSIQAVEVYNGRTTVPPIYQPACAAVAIWTRKG